MESGRQWQFFWWLLAAALLLAACNSPISQPPASEGEVGSLDVGTLNWSYDFGADSGGNQIVVSTPTAIDYDGTVYVVAGSGADNRLYAINPDSSLKWSAGLGPNISPITSPTIGPNGTIYVGIGYTENFRPYGRLYAFNPDGSPKWVTETFEGRPGFHAYIPFSPAIGADGTIYMGLNGNTIAWVVAINPHDGSVTWAFETNGSIASSPAISNNDVVHVITNMPDGYDHKGALLAVNPDGTLKWSYQSSLDFCCAIAIGADGTIYTGSTHGALYAFNSDGSAKWHHIVEPRGGLYAPPNVEVYSPTIGTGGMIYVQTNDQRLHAINPDGTREWYYQLPYPTSLWDAFYWLGGYQQTIGADGTIYAGADKILYAFNPNGTLRWSYLTDGWVYLAPAIGADGTVYSLFA